MRAVFGAKKHELSVSTYQMVILLLFNQKSEMTYRDISTSTSIPIADLKRNLLALACGKYKILVKTGVDKKIGDDDQFSFNSKFKSKLFRVKIMAMPQRETTEERKETREKVDEDRKHQIEAAIVRTMKARKSCDHSNLIVEVTKQLSSRFIPNPQLIKKRIESLIEREYLERSKEDRKIYHYMA